MKYKLLIKNLSFFGAIFTIIFGSLLHFFYTWTNENIIVDLFSPVNESSWEHMKMVFTPFILFAFVDYYYLRNLAKNYCFALIKQITVAIAFILIVFYIYSPIAHDNILAIDIASFIIGIILAKYVGYKILTGSFKKLEFSYFNVLSAIVLVVLTLFFIYVTFNRPNQIYFLTKLQIRLESIEGFYYLL